MSTAQIREKISTYVHQADDRFIHLVYGMMKEDKKGTAVYSVQGKPLNQQQYRDEIDEAREQFENGDYITHKALEKKTKNW